MLNKPIGKKIKYFFLLLNSCRNIFWNETGNLVCLATDECYFILRVDTGAIAAALETKQGLGEDGLEDAFDVSGGILFSGCI